MAPKNTTPSKDSKLAKSIPQNQTMPRGKVNIAYISNDSARKTTFKKRKAGLLKKAMELTTLCDVEACGIIFHPYSPEPEVWPSQLEAQRVIARFRNMAPPEQTRRMADQEGFVRQMLDKITGKVMKLGKDNQDKEMTQVMYQCLAGTRGFGNLSIPELHFMSGLIGQNLRAIDRRLDSFRRASQ